MGEITTMNPQQRQQITVVPTSTLKSIFRKIEPINVMVIRGLDASACREMLQTLHLQELRLFAGWAQAIKTLNPGTKIEDVEIGILGASTVYGKDEIGFLEEYVNAWGQSWGFKWTPQKEMEIKSLDEDGTVSFVGKRYSFKITLEEGELHCRATETCFRLTSLVLNKANLRRTIALNKAYMKRRTQIVEQQREITITLALLGGQNHVPIDKSVNMHGVDEIYERIQNRAAAIALKEGITNVQQNYVYA